jgi:hypothetical protein
MFARTGARRPSARNLLGQLASSVLALAGVVPILTVNFNRFYLALAPKLLANWRSNSRP